MPLPPAPTRYVGGRTSAEQFPIAESIQPMTTRLVPDHAGNKRARNKDSTRRGTSNRVLTWTVDLYRCMERGGTFALAAQTAFWLFLSLIPLAAVAGLIAARFSIGNWERLTPVVNALPSSTRDLVKSELLTVSRWNSGTVGLTSGIVFIWAASSGLHAIFDALEMETGAQRPWGTKRLLAVATCLMLSVAVAILAVIGPGLEGGLEWLSQYVPQLAMFHGEPTMPGRVLRIAVSAVLLFGYIGGFYWVGVPPEVRRGMPIIPGAIVAVVLEGALSLGYSLYVARMGVGAAYGTGLKIIALTMTALYFFSIALLTGAVVNRKLAAGRARRNSAQR